MIKHPVLAPFVLATIALAACSPEQDAAGPTETQAPDPSVQAPPDSEAVADPDRNLDPPILTPEAERGETGARNVLVSFARDIELERYDAAWELLSAADRKKWPKAEFAVIFSDLEEVTVAVPTGEMEGAAGSLYYTAPVTITGTDVIGRPVTIEGEAILRRTNDVDGATPEQRRWHFQSLSLDWTH
ncbi:hypothetical protein AMC99_01897 [Altererythrobacter epoxidivorans]|uniref:Lipoprotein n=1 Tax=Altererythrobacter epoxidivorans TaxID=361183 RepID=A0A0M4M8X0_9SPHN|nr:hypothetical protein [Altererythrobacter epoxidivorans]ALE17185.1 hypothetical protein AMC99_01897 [Altererythrobacter epoxidivorans]